MMVAERDFYTRESAEEEIKKEKKTRKSLARVLEVQQECHHQKLAKILAAMNRNQANQIGQRNELPPK